MIQSLGEEKTILVVAQRDARQDSPEGGDLHQVGTRATVHKVVKMPNQSLFVFTEGMERVRLGEFDQTQPFLTANYSALEEVVPERSPGGGGPAAECSGAVSGDCYVVFDPLGRSADHRSQY